tara:strand:+ start:575 stop:997 length:423 start_codon:yes stop_codon:yes gene_type:complete
MPVTPLLTVDCVIFESKSVLLIKRRYDPYKNWYALPGGFVDIGETVEEACCRELKEETGLIINPNKLLLIGVYSDPERDNRFHSASAAFLARPSLDNLKAGDDALTVEFVKDWREVDIAFDHKKIIEDAYNLNIELRRNL